MSIENMNTVADALAWALRRIETSNLGEGENFARAKELLDRAQVPDGSVWDANLGMYVHPPVVAKSTT